MCIFIVALDAKMSSSWFEPSCRGALPRDMQTCTVTGTKARAWSTAAIVPLLLYCCCIHTAVPISWLRGSAAAIETKNSPLSLIGFVCLRPVTAHTPLTRI